MKYYQKLSVIFGWVLFVIFVSSQNLYSQKEELIIEVENPGRPGSLKFHNPKGSVIVEGYDGEFVIVSAVVRNSSSNSRSVPEGMNIIKQSYIDLKAETTGNDIQLFCDSERTIDFDIKVPREFSLNIASMDNGEISVTRINGEVDIENRSGGVSLANISGSCVVTTVYGDISADIRKLKSDDTVMLTSYEGEIEMFIPADIDADFLMKSQYGGIFSDLPLKTGSSNIDVKEKGEGKEYHLQSWTKSRLNRGGGNIFLSSYSGDLLIKRSVVSFN